MANGLNRGGVEVGAYLGNTGALGLSITDGQFGLDELVVAECAVDLCQYRFAQSLAGNRYHWLEVVANAAQVFDLFGVEGGGVCHRIAVSLQEPHCTRAVSMAKSRRSWIQQHLNDPYVKQAQKDGYRSRASYKLLELQEKDRLIRPGMTVVDLGAAPGGWSQVAAREVGHSGRVFALDILDMDAIAGVEFLRGDFTDEAVYHQLLEMVGEQPVDLVISDMAPNLSGVKAIDQPRAMHLAELALEMVSQVLKPGGDYVSKLFQGEGFDDYIRQVRQQFDRVLTRKPESSRSKSREVYLVAKGYKS